LQRKFPNPDLEKKKNGRGKGKREGEGRETPELDEKNHFRSSRGEELLEKRLSLVLKNSPTSQGLQTEGQLGRKAGKKLPLKGEASLEDVHANQEESYAGKKQVIKEKCGMKGKSPFLSKGITS